ncbi:hypothetical protein ACHAWF_011748 [Thalassiosira exigua]
MSQMDLSQQDGAPSDDDSGLHADAGIDTTTGGAVRASSAEDEFVDAMDGLDGRHPSTAACHPSSNGSAASGSESNYGILERCGRWLMAIPRDDVVALQQTSEYREFLSAFDKLGEAHRRTVMLERQHLMEREDDDMAEYSASMSSVADFAATASNIHPPHPLSHTINTKSISTRPLPPPPLSHHMSPSSALRRRRYSFLQHLAVDDVLLRIFEFIDCSSLVRTGTTCHRFHELTTRSAEQRTQRLADGRLLRSAMKMLRAQEQIEGVGPREGQGPFVPIPMLGLRRRVRVSDAGDPEYNGVYFCTGSNGNGFLFTKPRSPERRVRARAPALDARHLEDLDIAGEAPVGHVVGDGAHNQNNPLFAAAAAVVGVGFQAVENNVDNIDGGQGDDAVDVLFGDEPQRSRLLRCVIAKRFSNETILWYMSKEVEDESSHEITQNFSFWAKLLVTGDANPDVCQYPSQTSILSRNGDPAWQPLTNTVNVTPPIVELLDG